MSNKLEALADDGATPETLLEQIPVEFTHNRRA